MEVRKGYKQTEVGVIPEDWEVKKLKDVAPLQRGFDLPNQFLVAGDYPVVYSNGIQNRHNKFQVKAPGIVTGRSGTIGKVTFTEEDYWPHNTSLWVTDFKNNDPKFIFYLFLRTKLERFAIGSGVPTLNRNDVHDFQVALPTKSEQTAIATALSDADALISSLEKLIAKKRAIKQGAMQELLKPKEGWEVKKLGEIGDVVTGSTPPTEIKEYWNGSIPWITPTDISNTQKNIFHSEREISKAGLNVIRKLPANTLLVTCIASIGKNAILRNNGACNQQINAITPYEDFYVDFLYYLIESKKQFLIGNAGITATLMISKKDFSDLSFVLPKLDEQTRIATILSDMDAEIAGLEEKLSKYKQVKQGMIQELLTGRVRLIV